MDVHECGEQHPRLLRTLRGPDPQLTPAGRELIPHAVLLRGALGSTHQLKPRVPRSAAHPDSAPPCASACARVCTGTRVCAHACACSEAGRRVPFAVIVTTTRRGLSTERERRPDLASRGRPGRCPEAPPPAPLWTAVRGPFPERGGQPGGASVGPGMFAFKRMAPRSWERPSWVPTPVRPSGGRRDDMVPTGTRVLRKMLEGKGEEGNLPPCFQTGKSHLSVFSSHMSPGPGQPNGQPAQRLAEHGLRPPPRPESGQ